MHTSLLNLRLRLENNCLYTPVCTTNQYYYCHHTETYILKSKAYLHPWLLRKTNFLNIKLLEDNANDRQPTLTIADILESIKQAQQLYEDTLDTYEAFTTAKEEFFPVLEKCEDTLCWANTIVETLLKAAN